MAEDSGCMQLENQVVEVRLAAESRTVAASIAHPANRESANRPGSADEDINETAGALLPAGSGSDV